MVVTADGTTIYALSQSGFLELPVSTLGTAAAPIATPDSNVALLASDQCGVTAAQNSAVIPVRSQTGAALNVTAQVLTTTSTSVSVRTTTRSYGGDVTASFSAAAARNLGTSAPDQLLIQAAQAVNIVPNVRIFQNNRNSEAAGTIIPVDIGATTTGLTDMLEDSNRQRLYIANPGLNRIEVFDMQQKKLLTPINVGQQPRSLAFGNDASTLYVANSGGESISLINLNNGTVSAVQFPALPSGTSLAIVTPQVIASSQNGPQVVMSDGTLWKVVGNTVVPRRPLNPAIFGKACPSPVPRPWRPRRMAHTFCCWRQWRGVLYEPALTILCARQRPRHHPGYYGPISAAPAGQYYLVNGKVLDTALTCWPSAAAAPPHRTGRPRPRLSDTRHHLHLSARLRRDRRRRLELRRFSTPVRANSTATVTDAGLVD